MTAYPIKRESLKYKLMGNTDKKCPKTREVMKKYFGEEYLERSSFRIKTLGAFCILFGVDQNCLIQELKKRQN